MRIRSQLQYYFKPQSPTVPFSKELLELDNILEAIPNYKGLIDLVYEDLQGPDLRSKSGRKGMSAEQVLGALILKFRKNCSYRELSELTHDDSVSVREFLETLSFSRGFHYKTLKT